MTMLKFEQYLGLSRETNCTEMISAKTSSAFHPCVQNIHDSYKYLFQKVAQTETRKL